MLTRQKILLFMLKSAQRPVERIELTKWCFLLRHESESNGGSSFYDFVPYRRGPFSFALYQEIGRLEELNYIFADGERTWRLNPEMAQPISGVGRTVENEVGTILAKHSSSSTEQLLDYVYEKHPYYTIHSERRKLAERPKTEVGVYTAGYEGLSIDRFLNLLVENGIERLIDVRSNPVSRRYGFHKSTLTRLTRNLEIDYVHFPELGIHSERRQGVPHGADRGSMFAEYERTTLASETDALNHVSKLVRDRPSVLVCMESDPFCCHRSRLANPLSELTRLPITHLRPLQ